MTVTSVGEWRNKQWVGEESSSTIVQRDTGVEIHGRDRTWRETKTDQQGHVGVGGGLELAVAGLKGAEIAGAHLAAVVEVALPVGALVVGFWGLHEAHANGDAQSAAISKDAAHVALAGALDLPGSCKQQLYTDRADTPRGPGAPAFRMTEGLMKDPAGLAVLQAHADRGVMSAYALVPSPAPAGLTFDKFLAAHPSLKEVCDEDAAFRVGVEAFFKAGPDDRKALVDNVQKHDVRASGPGITLAG